MREEDTAILHSIANGIETDDDGLVTYWYEGICPRTGERLRLPRTRFVERIARALMALLNRENTPREGKMYGVLLVATATGEREVLRAFSGLQSGQSHVLGWVPPIPGREQLVAAETLVLARLEAIEQEMRELKSLPYHNLYQMSRENWDKQLQLLTQRHRDNKRERQQKRLMVDLDEIAREKLNEISRREGMERRNLKRERDRELSPLLEQKETIERRLGDLKQQRQCLSRQLQELFYRSYCLTNFAGESLSLRGVMGDNRLPTGTGECCAPKLLHYAAIQGVKPLAMAEFWWGSSTRVQGEFYGACPERCQPLMGFLLSGLQPSVEIIYEDEAILAVNKSIELLSVTGRYRDGQDSVWTRLRRMGQTVIPAHRLDRETSGILLFAKDKESYRHLARQFQDRSVNKVYEALLSGNLTEEQGSIELPLSPDLDRRPYQKVDYTRGKPSITRFRVMDRQGDYPRLEFRPLTGRTHQIRVHCQRGLGVAILGDRLYGEGGADRLYLHARELAFRHPRSGELLHLQIATPF